MLAGCGQNAAELAALKAENERLRAELANARRISGGEKEPVSASGSPDQILSINELWRQRFEDNDFRSKLRLTDKTLRVTGILDDISRESVSIYGVGKSRIRVSVNLDKNYAARIQTGLASLEKGVTVTVQGKFAFDRMELNESTIVDAASGTPMTTEQLQAFGQIAPGDAPVPEKR